MKYRKEFVAKFNKEATFYSCDDLNKLRMGLATAVSRYHQIFRIFVNNDMPNVGDHDFPNTSYLIVSARYMTLEPNIARLLITIYWMILQKKYQLSWKKIAKTK